MKQGQFKSVLYIAIVGLVITLLVQHFHIQDFRIIAPQTLYVSGQPKGMDYTRLFYKYHISTIVNVRSAVEHLEKNWRNEEFLKTHELAIKYIEIPINKEHFLPDLQTQAQFLEIMSESKNLPVLLHGASDDKRVAMLVAVWARKLKEYSLEDTLVQVQKIIDDRPLTADELDFIKSL
jgi:protein tyrosine/serine phosphatase